MGRLYGFYVLYREIPIFPGLRSAKSSQQTRLMKRDLRGGVSGGGGGFFGLKRVELQARARNGLKHSTLLLATPTPSPADGALT